MENKWILFCAQEAGFQTRSMLIPYSKYISNPRRVENLQTLKEHSGSRRFELRGVVYEIDNLLVQDIKWGGRFGKYVDHPFTKIVHELASYADGLDDDCYFNIDDKEWYDDAICGVASKGFNHLKNFTTFLRNPVRKGKRYEIVESFLVLESDDGKIQKPQFDDVEEMYYKTYMTTG